MANRKDPPENKNQLHFDGAEGKLFIEPPKPTAAQTFMHQVIEETSGRCLGNLEFEREIQKDECLFHDGAVYRVRWMGILGPAVEHRRVLRVYETCDGCFVARLN